MPKGTPRRRHKLIVIRARGGVTSNKTVVIVRMLGPRNEEIGVEAER